MTIQFVWDLEDDPEGNYWHIVVEGHGVTREEGSRRNLERRAKPDGDQPIER